VWFLLLTFSGANTDHKRKCHLKSTLLSLPKKSLTEKSLLKTKNCQFYMLWYHILISGFILVALLVACICNKKIHSLLQCNFTFNFYFSFIFIFFFKGTTPIHIRWGILSSFLWPTNFISFHYKSWTDDKGNTLDPRVSQSHLEQNCILKNWFWFTNYFLVSKEISELLPIIITTVIRKILYWLRL